MKLTQVILLICFGFFDIIGKGNAEETIPLTHAEILDLINEFPTLENISEIPGCLQSEKCAQRWLKKVNRLYSKVLTAANVYEFQFLTNITDETEKLVTELAPLTNKISEITRATALQFYDNSEDWSENTQRMLHKISQGIIYKNPEDAIMKANLASKLQSIYAQAKVCQNSSCISFDPDITDIFAQSRDYDQLLNIWKGWHDSTGPKMRKMYAQIVELENKAARETGYTDLSQFWMEDFEDDDFENTYDNLFEKVKPIYDQLHLYVRNKLRKVYGSKYPKDHDENLIPAHLLGQMWAQQWNNILDLVLPYPNEKQVDVTSLLIKNNYTVNKLFKEAENFYVSLGLYPMTKTFWEKSMLEKPLDRSVECYASAFDFSNQFDFRIKMCTSIDLDNFYTVHHEMGHIEYYMAYRNQPAVFKEGANSAFHEAVGDTIALSVLSWKHLENINLLKSGTVTKEQEINYLMEQALKKIAFLPFGYLMDKWRWDVFRGNINESNYNEKWWQMRKDYQGLEAPCERSENDFDPGSKYHIPSFVPYARYFLAEFLQFQFYEALCKLSGHRGPLHNCDFYQSKKAGKKFKKMLELGSSKHWSYALEILTGQTSVNPDSLIKYFEPLIEWLKIENMKE